MRGRRAGRREALIEAVARTLIMGFRDDVVVRVTPLGTGTRIDIRSASRYGLARLRRQRRARAALLEDIDDAVNAAPEPRSRRRRNRKASRPNGRPKRR